jgi:hypothetical protein
VRRWRHRFATENAQNIDNAANIDDEQRPLPVMLDDHPRSCATNAEGGMN